VSAVPPDRHLRDADLGPTGDEHPVDGRRVVPAKVDALIAEVAAVRRMLDGGADPDGYLSLSAAAKFAGVSRRFIEKAIAAGDLVGANRGRRRLIGRRKLVEWMEAGE
jgi:excisionase family DNA binding protein